MGDGLLCVCPTFATPFRTCSSSECLEDDIKLWSDTDSCTSEFSAPKFLKLIRISESGPFNYNLIEIDAINERWVGEVGVKGSNGQGGHDIKQTNSNKYTNNGMLLVF